MIADQENREEDPRFVSPAAIRSQALGHAIEMLRVAGTVFQASIREEGREQLITDRDLAAHAIEIADLFRKYISHGGNNLGR